MFLQVPDLYSTKHPRRLVMYSYAISVRAHRMGFSPCRHTPYSVQQAVAQVPSYPHDVDLEHLSHQASEFGSPAGRLLSSGTASRTFLLGWLPEIMMRLKSAQTSASVNTSLSSDRRTALVSAVELAQPNKFPQHAVRAFIRKSYGTGRLLFLPERSLL